MDSDRGTDTKDTTQHKIRELEQEKLLLQEINEFFITYAKELERSKVELEGRSSDQQFRIKEIEQEKIMLEELNEFLTVNTKEFERSKKELEEKISSQKNNLEELEQEKNLLGGLVIEEQKISFKLNKKYYMSIAVIAIITSTAFVGYSYYQNQVLIETTKVLLENYNSRYVIQNLKGDTVDTWISWRLADGRGIDVNIVNKADVSNEIIDAIKEAIISTKGIELDDSLLNKGPQGSSSTYYTGWAGALEKASAEPTVYFIPREFNIIDSSSGSGQVTITLVTQKDPDGYSGFTQSITDNNQILKSTITIYEADKVTKEQMGAIIRHEFGHALGLAHSTASEDLMAPIIKTEYPYISDCDIDAIRALYDGKRTSQVVCEK